jgi:hypothetical protein
LIIIRKIFKTDQGGQRGHAQGRFETPAKAERAVNVRQRYGRQWLDSLRKSRMRLLGAQTHCMRLFIFISL